MRKQILPSPPGTERPPTRRLLLVEDDPALALMLSWELEERGIAVSLACTCTDGRTLPQGLAFDTALVDADLPDGDGVVLAQTLARCHPRARVAIYTGHHGIAERLREMNRGCACPVLTKPVTLSHLLWALGLGALGLGLVALTRPDPLALATAAIDHVRGEPQALVSDQHLAPERIAVAFDRAGSVLIGAPQVSYAGRCPLPGGGLGEHLVLRLPEGKATLVLMPSKRVSRVARTAKDGLHAMVRPAGKGSLALVAGSNALIGAAETYLRQQVRWSDQIP